MNATHVFTDIYDRTLDETKIPSPKPHNIEQIREGKPVWWLRHGVESLQSKTSPKFSEPISK